MINLLLPIRNSLIDFTVFSVKTIKTRDALLMLPKGYGGGRIRN